MHHELQEMARSLRMGQKTRLSCHLCGNNNNSGCLSHEPRKYFFYCFSCGESEYHDKGQQSLAELKRIKELNDEALNQTREVSLPEDITYDPASFSPEGRMWLFKAGITPKLIRRYGVGFSAASQRVVLPVYGEQRASSTERPLLWLQARAVLRGQKPKYVQPSMDRSTIIFNPTPGRITRLVIIVEDILSAIRVYEAVGHLGITAVSLLGTKITTGQVNVLSRADKCITWLDSDRAGRQGATAISKALGLLCDVGNIRTVEDPKCHSNKQILEIVKCQVK